MNTQRNKNQEKHDETNKTVVLHEDLLKACTNDLLAEVTYSAPTHLEINSEWHICITCSIKDISNGRMMSAIGSASPSTMQTEIQKRNPIKTAEIRAFDHAMMLILGMDETTVSNWDFCSSNIESVGQNQSQDQLPASDSQTEKIPELSMANSSEETNIVTQTLITGVTEGPKPSTQTSVTDKRRLFDDNEVMLIGDGLVGYTYEVVKRFRLQYLMNFLEYLSTTPNIHYDDEAKQQQLEKLYEAARRCTPKQASC